MSYEDDLAAVKAEAMKDGVTKSVWDKWEYPCRVALQKRGFANAAHVRRVADRNSRREH